MIVLEMEHAWIWLHVSCVCKYCTSSSTRSLYMRVMPFLVSLAPCKGMRVMLLWHDGPCVRASFTCIGLVEWACSFSDCRYLVLSCQYQPHRRKYWTQHWVQPSSPGNQCNYKTWSSWLARICILSKQKRFVRTPRWYFFFHRLVSRGLRV